MSKQVSTVLSSSENEMVDNLITDLIEESEFMRAIKEEKKEMAVIEVDRADLFLDTEELIEKNFEKTSCMTCQYSTIREDGSSLCGRNKLTSDREIVIPASKVDTSCPVHSEYNKLETRYVKDTRWLFEAKDVCKKCHRQVENKTNKRVTCKLCEK